MSHHNTVTQQTNTTKNQKKNPKRKKPKKNLTSKHRRQHAIQLSTSVPFLQLLSPTPPFPLLPPPLPPSPPQLNHPFTASCGELVGHLRGFEMIIVSFFLLLLLLLLLLPLLFFPFPFAQATSSFRRIPTLLSIPSPKTITSFATLPEHACGPNKFVNTRQTQHPLCFLCSSWCETARRLAVLCCRTSIHLAPFRPETLQESAPPYARTLQQRNTTLPRIRR